MSNINLFYCLNVANGPCVSAADFKTGNKHNTILQSSLLGLLRLAKQGEASFHAACIVVSLGSCIRVQALETFSHMSC